MLAVRDVRQLLEPFSVKLDESQLPQLLIYLDLLMKWNRKINLTAIRDEHECVVRHFGESLFLASQVELKGSLVDVGSGAGFPGLALKLACPDLHVTLLEPTAKKRAFLKEVVRACEMSSVVVLPNRLENLSVTTKFDAATMRAVGHLTDLLGPLVRHVKRGGKVYIWATDIGNGAQNKCVRWISRIPIPLSRNRQIWVGSIDRGSAGEAPASLT